MTTLGEIRNRHIKENLDAIITDFVEHDMNPIPVEELFAGTSERSKAIHADFAELLAERGYSSAREGVYMHQHEGSFELVVQNDFNALAKSDKTDVPNGYTYLVFKDYTDIEGFMERYCLMNKPLNERVSILDSIALAVGGTLVGSIAGGVLGGGFGLLVGAVGGCVAGIYGTEKLTSESFDSDKNKLLNYCDKKALAISFGRDAMVDALHYTKK